MRLVDHDEAQVRQGRHDRRPRADDDPRLAPQDAPPRVVPLPRRHARVQGGHRVARERRHPIDELRHAGQLRDEEDGGAAGGEHGVEGGKVDVGLAGRGDAFEQQLAAGCHPGDRLDGGTLLGREPVRRRSSPGAMRERVTLLRAPAELGSAALGKPPRRRQQPARIDGQLVGELGKRALAARDRCQERGLQWRAAGSDEIGRGRAQGPDPSLADLGRTQGPCRPHRSRPAQPFEPRLAAPPRRVPQQGRILDPVLAVRQARQLARKRLGIDDVPGALEAGLEPGGQHRCQGGADRGAVVGGDLLGQCQQVRGEHRLGDDRLDVSQLRTVAIGLDRSGKEVPEGEAAAVGHEHERARLRRSEGIGQDVGECALRTVGEGVDRNAHRAAGHRLVRRESRVAARDAPRPG